MKTFDASGAVVGRLAAWVAKQLLLKEKIVIVNAEKAVFSGSPDFVFRKYYKRRRMKDKSNPEHSAKWPRRPDLFLRRIVKGMLPKRASRQKEALSNLRVYMGVPDHVSTPEPFATRTPSETITIEQLCERLGWAST